MYENSGAWSTGAGAGRTTGSVRPTPSAPSNPYPRPKPNRSSPSSAPSPPRRTTTVGGFSSSDSASDLFERNAQKRDRDRRTKTGAYDPNQSTLEDKLASLMKNAAEAEERYARLQKELSSSKVSLQKQNDALRKDAEEAREKCKSLEKELVKAASQSKATANTMSSKEKAMLGGKIASLRKEASDAKARCKSLEKEVEMSKSTLRKEKEDLEGKIAVAKARCESLEAALKKSKADAADLLSSHGGGALDEEKEALKAKIADLEKDLRNHVDVVQKYRKQSQALRREARTESFKKAGGGVADSAKAGFNAIIENMKRADQRAAKANKDEMERLKESEFVAKRQCKSLEEERKSRQHEVEALKQALASSQGECDRLRASESAARSRVFDRAAPLQNQSKGDINVATRTNRIPARARINMTSTHHDASDRADDFASAVGMAPESKCPAVYTRAKRSRIPTGASTNTMHKISKNIDDFSSAIGLGSTKEISEELNDVSAQVSTRGRSRGEGGLVCRVNNQMHKKKTLIIAGSLALLFARSFLKVWIRGGLL